MFQNFHFITKIKIVFKKSYVKTNFNETKKTSYTLRVWLIGLSYYYKHSDLKFFLNEEMSISALGKYDCHFPEF